MVAKKGRYIEDDDTIQCCLNVGSLGIIHSCDISSSARWCGRVEVPGSALAKVGGQTGQTG